MRFGWLAVLLVAACGRVGFDPYVEGTPQLGDEGRESRDSDGGRASDAGDADAMATGSSDVVSCSTSAACGAGRGCTLFGGPEGTCEPRCEASASCEHSGVCAPESASSTLATCLSPCDPEANVGCPGELGCRVLRVATVEGPQVFGASCGPSEGASDGASCSSLLDCAPGTVCVSGRCADLCSNLLAACRGEGRTARACTPFDPPLRVDGRNFGYCPL